MKGISTDYEGERGYVMSDTPVLGLWLKRSPQWQR